MKLKVYFEMEKDELPLDYRRGFISLIKACFEKGNKSFYNQMYNKRTDKPFTFSVYFPRLTKEKNRNFIKTGKNGILYFSTIDYLTLINFYNGALKLKEHQWQQFNTFSILKMELLKEKKISSNKCIFKTISPFLVNMKDRNLWYLSCEDPDFDHAFRFNIKELTKKFLNKNLTFFNYKIIRYKKMVVSHYNQSMTCNKAVIEIESNYEVLNLLYNVGIGVRRSQGFGMIDLI